MIDFFFKISCSGIVVLGGCSIVIIHEEESSADIISGWADPNISTLLQILRCDNCQEEKGTGNYLLSPVDIIITKLVTYPHTVQDSARSVFQLSSLFHYSAPARGHGDRAVTPLLIPHHTRRYEELRLVANLGCFVDIVTSVAK